jgi:hypothetical protein
VKQQQQEVADDELHGRITLAEADHAVDDDGFDIEMESDSKEAEEDLVFEIDENHYPNESMKGLDYYLPKPLSRKVTGFKKKTNNILNKPVRRRKPPPNATTICASSLNENLDENSTPTLQDLSNRSS